MKASRIATASLVLCSVSLGCAGSGAARPDAGLTFAPLFNRKDLTGWVKVLDSAWVVEDGVLLSRQDPAG
ncbi:MAG: hypothetical protein HY721_21660, partial [Planctomycetes bacterium]|nr:hypothetical protein [Planctomycetota bacterium]